MANVAKTLKALIAEYPLVPPIIKISDLTPLGDIMKRIHSLLLLLFLLFMAGIVLGQDTPSFGFAQTIGRQRPQGIVYNPPLDQFAWVDSTGSLQLVDAATYQTQAVLHQNDTYNAYTFSHDGTMLALAVARRVELWDTRSGTLLATLEPDGANSTTGPLMFAEDDQMLLFTAIVPAPPELRRSENDTSNLPWLWDIPSALDQANSSLPRGVEAYPFFEFRNGFILGAHDKALVARPQRLQLIDVANSSLPVIAEIETQRNEQDPISIWFSLRDDMMYVRPINQNNLIQIDTDDGSHFDIPVGRELNARRLQEMDGLVLSSISQIIGAPNTRESSSFLRLLLGDDYRSSWNYHPLTVILVDILQPITVSQSEMGLLIYVFDEERGIGYFDFVRPFDILRMTLHPDNLHFMVRRAAANQPIEIYSLETGALERSYIPALRDLEGNHPLAYTADGAAIISDFQRFDAQTGSILYQDLSYNLGFDRFFFTQDSSQLVTLTGFDWWVWDIQTAEVVRRETLTQRGELLQTSPDGHRFLTALNLPEGVGREIVEIGKDQRRSIIFDHHPTRDMIDIIPSPDWENYLVIYSVDFTSTTPAGMAASLYNIDAGRRWYLEADDLPATQNLHYGWLDNITAYFYGTPDLALAQTERIYGLDFHPSGLPQCLVNAFPDGEWEQWRDLWQRLNYRLTPDALGHLTQALCTALPAAAQEVNTLLQPSPTPTRIPVTPLPSIIAGVPECLTQRYPNEAVAYGRDWREITAGLSREQVEELETLLCDGLVNAPSSSFFDESGTPPLEVITLNINTGQRTQGSYIPPTEPQPTRLLELVLNEFERTAQIRPGDSLLSPNGALLAARNLSNHIIIFRLLKPYETIVAEATATAAPQQPASAEDDRRIAVRPTATQPSDQVGPPLPTPTPTITPTPPPLPAEPANQPQAGEIAEVCPADNLQVTTESPLDPALTGRLLTTVSSSRDVWVVEPATGRFYPDDTIPRCNIDIACEFSFDQRWILSTDSSIRVFRPDGSDQWVLFEPQEQPVWPQSIYWVDNGTLEYVYSGYLPEQTIIPLSLYRHAVPETRTLSEPFLPQTNIRINELAVELHLFQPANGPLALARLAFKGGPPYQYYIYNRETDTADYFARLNEDLFAQWHPLGKALYYRHPTSPDWYIYEVATGQHHVLGELPEGQWSREGRYRVRDYITPAEEREIREELGQPIPNLQIWDSETGLIRRYCLPQINPFVASTGQPEPELTPVDLPTPTLTPDQGINIAPITTTYAWSPDSRHLAIHVTISASTVELSTVYSTILILDTQTGIFTEVPASITGIITWMEDGE